MMVTFRREYSKAKLTRRSFLIPPITAPLQSRKPTSRPAAPLCRQCQKVWGKSCLNKTFVISSSSSARRSSGGAWLPYSRHPARRNPASRRRVRALDPDPPALRIVCRKLGRGGGFAEMLLQPVEASVPAVVVFVAHFVVWKTIMGD